MDLNSREKSVLLDRYVQKRESSFEERRENEANYLREGEIQVDSYVFVSPNIKRQRGFDEQVGLTFFQVGSARRLEINRFLLYCERNYFQFYSLD